MRFAYLAAQRATCPRRHVGAVIVDAAHRQVSTGYNGAPPHQPSCDDIGCQMVDNHCVRTLHAESNALDYAGHRLIQGCTLYVTVTPCWDCAKRIVCADFTRVVYDEHYESRYGKSTDVPDYLREAGIVVDRFEPERMARFKSLMAALDVPSDIATVSGQHSTIVPPSACAIHRFDGDGPCVVCGISDS
jgi:dCMP deaminase